MPETNRLQEFGFLIGQAFQLVDDLLDVTSSAEALGKKTAKDRDRGKSTLVELLGVEVTRRMASELLSEALSKISMFCYYIFVSKS